MKPKNTLVPGIKRNRDMSRGGSGSHAAHCLDPAPAPAPTHTVICTKGTTL